MCILMLWMASARYYVNTKNQKKIKKINIGEKLWPPFKKIKNMPGQNLFQF